MADNKSSLVQIAQAVLDEESQTIKTLVTVDGAPVDADNPLPVVIDSQSIVVEVGLDKNNDSVTAWQGGGSWSVTNAYITEAVATVAKQNSQITELQAIKGYVDGIEPSLTSIDSKVSSLAVTGSGAATTALRVQLADESLSALENISVTISNSSVEIANDSGNPIPVSGTVTANTGLVQPLTDSQLRASAVPISGTVTANTGLTQPLTDSQLRASAVPVSVSSLPLPSGAATESTLLDIKANTARLNYVNRVRLAYSSTNVTTGAWVELLSSVGATAVKEIEIFDSSGETLELGIGASGSESSKCYVFPGGNGRIPVQIAATARIAIKAVSATANSGEILINFYG